jgi:hypothetical protein
MAAGDLIDRFLHDLDRGLQPLGRRRRSRVVAEARDHLCEAAARGGEAEALAQFGTASELAAAHIRGAATAAPRRTIVAFALAGVSYALVQVVASPAAFGVFPPGPWPDDRPPRYLSWKVDLAAGLVGLAFLVGLVCIAVAWAARHQPSRRLTWVPRLALIGSAVFAASWPFEATFLIQRGFNVDGSPPTWVTAAVCAALLTCHAATLWVARRATRVVTALAASG